MGRQLAQIRQPSLPARPVRRPRLEIVSCVEPPFSHRPEFLLRLGLLHVLALCAFAALGLRLWSLQVLQHERYASTAVRTSQRLIERPAPRGAIYDVRGRLLAGTEGRPTLVGEPAVLGRYGLYGRWVPSPRGRAVLARLAKVAGLPQRTLLRRLRTSLRRNPYAPAPLLPVAPRRLAGLLEESARSFPGVRVEEVPVRSYPDPRLGGVVLGLVGEITADQLREPGFRGYEPGQHAGRFGVELAYDRDLNGGMERALLPVDARGRPAGALRPLGRSRRPLSLRLTLDARFQRAALRALRLGVRSARAAGHRDARSGAAIVMDARTGALYALASYPGFDQAAAARNEGYLVRLVRGVDRRLPLFNRATQGLFPPGSTFKPFVAAAALSSGFITPSSRLPCTGSLAVGDRLFRNVDPWANASLTLSQALSISCDTWFYRLGLDFYDDYQRRRVPVLQRWARRFGFGRRTGVELPGEARGLVPEPRSSGRARVFYPGDYVNLSIGQGGLLVTPLQVAVAYAALANGGRVVRPHVGAALLTPRGRVVEKLRFPSRARLSIPGLEAIRRGLLSAAREGTAGSVFAGFPVTVAGKTGTAEAPGGSDHSWYASWAPARAPRYVVVVLIEHGGFGAEAAAPAAREIYRALFRLGE